jgi:ketosteroid isomerase-like protein
MPLTQHQGDSLDASAYFESPRRDEVPRRTRRPRGRSYASPVSPMARENVALLRRLYDAFNEGDLDALMDHFAPDAEQIVATLGQTNSGLAEIRNSFEEYLEVVEAHRTEPLEFIEEGEQVVVLVRLHGRMRHTQITDAMIPVEMAHVFAFRDGQIVWNYICVDRDEALAAARAFR